MLASGIPKNFFALHKYPVASRHRVETENVSHERLFPNTCNKKSDVPVHFLVRKNSCAVFNSMSFVLWSSRTIRSVSYPTTVTHLKYSAAAKRAVSKIKQSALSLPLTYYIPGILSSFNAKKSTKLCLLSRLERNCGLVRSSTVSLATLILVQALCVLCRCVESLVVGS